MPPWEKAVIAIGLVFAINVLTRPFRPVYRFVFLLTTQTILTIIIVFIFICIVYDSGHCPREF
jgi:hypothetical protein